jgi:hypothetical protein
LNKNIPIDDGCDSPGKVAKWVIHMAETYFDKHLVPVRGAGAVNLVRHFFDEMLTAKSDNAWKWEQRYLQARANPGKDDVPNIPLLAMVAVAYSLAAIREERLSTPNRAWEFATKAIWFLGLFGGDQERFDIEASTRSRIGRLASDALHNKPKGSRANQALIRAAWASGKFTSRDVCAEQESASIGMSFSAARRALRNTPDPQR